MNKKRVGRQIAASVLLFAGSLAMMGSAQAAFSPPFGLGEKGFPDIQSQSLTTTYSYDSGSDRGTFAITGTSTFQNYAVDSSDPGTFFFGDYTMEFTVDGSGALTTDSPNSFLITDTSGLLLGGAGTVLSGAVSEFAMTATSIETLVAITTDTLGTFGSPVGVIATTGTGLAGFDFTADVGLIGAPGGSASDTFTPKAVPEPSVISLLALGSLGILGFRRRRKGSVA